MSGNQHTMVRQLNDIPTPVGFKDALVRKRMNIQVSASERALLNCFLALISRVDPDVIVGHNVIGFGLDVLLHRFKAQKIELNWSKLGRLRRKRWPKMQPGAGGMGESTYDEKQIVSGRLFCDTYLVAKDFIKSKNYSMQELATSQLKVTREELDHEKIPDMFWNAEDLCRLIAHCEKDAYLSMALMMKLQMLPLTKQLTNLAGNMWSRTMTGARAERNEFLLLHEFHKAKFVVPDKAAFGIKNVVTENDEEVEGYYLPLCILFNNLEEARRPGQSGRKKPAYSGGLVLEPKKGFYDKYVLLLDFNSLYPSIIQEYNICFTTIQRDANVRHHVSHISLNILDVGGEHA